MDYFIKLHSIKEENEIWLKPNRILAMAQVANRDVKGKVYPGTEITYETGTREVTKALVKETPTEILEVMRKALADYCEDHTKIGELPQGQTCYKNCPRYSPVNTAPWVATPSIWCTVSNPR